jgi:phosphoribosylformylglycinamidine cyclo-ligase
MESGLTYREAGVDLEAAARAKTRLGELVEQTRTEAVAADFGSFGGRFRAPAGRELVASADGVGTKLKLAFLTGRHDTVGVDLVNHCVNDILTEGAVPLVFMDYFACGSLDPDTVVAVVSGLAAACRENGCALLGGETAEMPDFYAPGEYDLAGFVVGQIEFQAVAAREIRPGDRIVGLASSGLHTNGYSFVRRLLLDRLGLGVSDPFPGTDASVGEVLLRSHRSYLDILRASCEARVVRALAHVTGGGIPGNLGRVLPATLSAHVQPSAWTPLPEFQFLREASGASRDEMYRTFNMGVGMLAIVSPDDEAAFCGVVEDGGCAAYPCGEIVEGDGSVILEWT